MPDGLGRWDWELGWWVQRSVIKSATLKAGKLAKVTGKGAALEHQLTTDPKPVAVVLRVGGERACLAFGGTTKFVAGTFSAKNAPAGSCP